MASHFKQMNGTCVRPAVPPPKTSVLLVSPDTHLEQQTDMGTEGERISMEDGSRIMIAEDSPRGPSFGLQPTPTLMASSFTPGGTGAKKWICPDTRASDAGSTLHEQIVTIIIINDIVAISE
ncbi:hypothetical protein XELAEV_18003000mg [Xenopus laevis]|nr:hypothetical protein XELAEV_18003000mg [Xenopus laevis]